jgi:hypothetical protein
MPTDVTSLHHVRVALARHDRANDGHAGQACDVMHYGPAWHLTEEPSEGWRRFPPWCKNGRYPAPARDCPARRAHRRPRGANLAGFFHMTQLAIAEMEKQGSGHVVQITTSLVNHANSAVPSVLTSLTKGGLDAATRSLAIEYAKRGIRVNAVAPGIIKTPMHSPAAFAQLDAMHPVGHMGEISDIVEAVLYLESMVLRARFRQSSGIAAYRFANRISAARTSADVSTRAKARRSGTISTSSASVTYDMGLSCRLTWPSLDARRDDRCDPDHSAIEPA